MSRVRFRRPVIVAALALIAPLTVACGAQAGSAALVGGVSISDTAIDAAGQTLTSLGPDVLATDLGGMQVLVKSDRTYLSAEIWHELLQQSGTPAATNEQVSQLITGYQGQVPLLEALNATPDTLNDRVRDTLAFLTVINDAVSAGTTLVAPQVTVDILPVADQASALAQRTEFLADPDAMTAAVASGQGNQVTVSAVSTDIELGYTGVFSAEPGQIVIVPASDTQLLLVRVVDRTTSSTVLDSTAASTFTTPAQFNALGALILGQQLADPARVQVNPRFGVWDPTMFQVVAGPGQL